MTTALSVYGLNGTSGVVGTAHTLGTALGGTGANISTKIGTSTGWGQIDGSALAWPALGAIGAEDGNGWILDASTLDGQQIIAGTWNASIRLSTSVGSITADLTMRASKYNGGVYTTIGSLSLSGQSITTTLATFTLNAASLGLMNFETGTHLYVGAWMNITANSTGSGTATLNCSVSSTATGLAGRVEMDTPGFIVSPKGFILSQQHRSIGRMY